MPTLIFLLDDYETNWHDHRHEAVFLVVLHNFAEDGAALVVWLGVRWWRNRAIPHIHAECPHCHFRWLTHPRQKIPLCPRCGAPEPP